MAIDGTKCGCDNGDLRASARSALPKDTPGRPARTVESVAALPTNLPGLANAPESPGDALRA